MVFTHFVLVCTQANEMLLVGKKLTAVEACNYGLVTEVIPQAEFKKEINNIMKYMAALQIPLRKGYKRIIGDTISYLYNKYLHAP